MAFFKPNLLQNCVRGLVRPSRGVADKAVPTSEKISSMSPQDMVKITVKPNRFNKFILVWTGRFKNSSEIPEIVSFETMQKARNMVRIKVSNYMMVATVFGCIAMVIAGKKAADSGESVAKMNLDWHKEYNEQAKAEAEAAKKLSNQ